ncbi:hypothetical protein ACH5RR_001341 [Cinchona calisaya]|uniref:DUF4283 domain-containing protein n=1 Tax=Cinchona calisaya TaxID=153742 RepID=A0ABD3B356_9GENT
MQDGLVLSFIPATDGECVKLEPSNVQDALNKWKTVVVGFVMGAAPPFQSMKRYVDLKWKEFGTVECTRLKSGVYIFKFESEESQNPSAGELPMAIPKKDALSESLDSKNGHFKRGAHFCPNLDEIPKFEAPLLYRSNFE